MNSLVQPGKLKKRKFIIFLMLSFLAIIFLCLAIFTFSVSGNTGNIETIPINIHSVDEANYQKDSNHSIIPVVHLDIVKNILHDQGQSSDEIERRLATLNSILSSEIPRATFTPTLSDQSIPISGTEFPSILTPPTPMSLMNINTSYNVQSYNYTNKFHHTYKNCHCYKFIHAYEIFYVDLFNKYPNIQTNQHTIHQPHKFTDNSTFKYTIHPSYSYPNDISYEYINCPTILYSYKRTY